MQMHPLANFIISTSSQVHRKGTDYGVMSIGNNSYSCGLTRQEADNKRDLTGTRHINTNLWTHTLHE